MRYYTETQEWVDLSEEEGRFGLTQAARQEMGDVVYLSIAPQGSQLKAKEEIALLESLKAAIDLLAPAACEVIEVNQSLLDDLSLLVKDPEGRGWIARVRWLEPVPRSEWKREESLQS